MFSHKRGDNVLATLVDWKRIYGVTDHKPLESLKVKARSDEPLGDLMFYLSQYHFKIVYSPGKDNTEADALSRNPVLECFENEEDILKVVNIVTLQVIIADQQFNENEIKASKKVIKKGDISFKQLRNRQRIFVSKRFGQELIQKVHEFYGHIGAAHITQKIRPHYYFKNMDRLVNTFCKACTVCTENKTRRCRLIGSISQLGPASYPYEIMSIDTVGGFSGNKSPKKYMHILADHFSRYAFILTSRTQSAKDFIKLIDSVAKTHNIKTILADRYSGINSSQLKNYLTKREIQLIFTSVNCPESNGLNERLNQTLVNRIRCKINTSSKKSWPTVAAECVTEYNNTIHSATKFAPAYLLFGRKSEIIPSELSTENTLERDREEAARHSLCQFNKNKQRIDKNRRDHHFKTDDLVYVEEGNKLNRGKLDKLRTGPYRIVKQVSNCIYEVDCKRKRKEANLFHQKNLIPFEN